MSPDGDLGDNAIRTPSDAGYVQMRPKFTRARRSWGLTYPDLPDTDAATLRYFELTTLHNGVDIFTWTHPKTGTTYNVQLSAPIKFVSSETIVNSTNVTMMLQEV
jgi:phage-related protein